MARDIDPGDAVPPGVAPQTPEPLTPADREVLHELERFGAQQERAADMAGRDQDSAVERETQTVRPHGDAPSRAGITGGGSGADGEGI